MGELDSTTRQKGATSRVLPVRLYSSKACSVTILRKMDVETGHVASQLFFSANLRLNARIDMVQTGAIVWSSAATSTGYEMCSLDPLGIPAKSFSKMTWWSGLTFIFSPHIFFALGIACTCCLVGRRMKCPICGADNPRENTGPAWRKKPALRFESLTSPKTGRSNQSSQHLERGNEPQVLDSLTH